MKKTFLLTSILALTACSGGGGGGGGTAPSAPVTPSAGTFTSGIYTNTEHNDNVTQMQTQVIVDSNGHAITPNLSRAGHIRAGSIQDTSGNSYNVYDLSDVKLFIPDETMAAGDPHTFLKIGLTGDGAIKDITLASGDQELQLERDGDTNRFRGPIFEYVENGHDKAKFRVVDTGQTMADLTALEAPNNLTGGHWNYIDERMEVTTNKHITANNANAPVLRYSDFGHFNPVYRSKHTELNADVLAAIRQYGADIEAALVAGDTTAFNTLLSESGLNRTNKDKYRTNDKLDEELAKEDYQLFAGGYAIDETGNLIASGTFDAPRDANFTGTGVGRVYTSIHADEDGVEQGYKDAILAQYEVTGDGHDVSKSFTTSSANLTVDANGNQELVMNFDNFYRVTATKTAAGVENIELDKPDGVTIATQYMKNGDVPLPGHATGDYQVTSNGSVSDPEIMFHPGYYGVGTPSEAAGIVRYADEATGIAVKDITSDTTKTFTREFEFQGAYGMTKD